MRDPVYRDELTRQIHILDRALGLLVQTDPDVAQGEELLRENGWIRAADHLRKALALHPEHAKWSYTTHCLLARTLVEGALGGLRAAAAAIG